jgi:hypothetical protein
VAKGAEAPLGASDVENSLCVSGLLLFVKVAATTETLPNCQPLAHSAFFEFCENGAKAVSDESTKKRIGPRFFANYSIAELAKSNEK